MATPWSVQDLYNIYISGTAADDAGNRPVMSREEFDKLPEAERFNLASLGGSNGQTNIFNDNGQIVGYGTPQYIGQGGFYNSASYDGNRFTLNGVNQDRLNDIQNATDRSGFFSGTPLQNIMRGAGIVLGAGGLNNFLTSGSAFGGSGVPTGGLLSESVAPQVTETMVGSPFSGAVSGAGALAESAAPQVTEQMAAAPNLGGNSWLSSLGSTIRNNPLSAIRLGMAGAGLIGGAMGNQQPQSGWGGLGGLLGGSLNIKKANWTPNPYSVSQLQQLYGGKF